MKDNNESNDFQNSFDESNDLNNININNHEEPAIEAFTKSNATHDFVDSVNSEYQNKKNLKKKKGLVHEIWQWIQAILIAVVIAYLINAFVFERASVQGPSMNPTLANGESLFEYKLGNFFGPPKHGDIVIFEVIPGKYKKYVPIPDPTEKDYIKRVIALPGETIDIKEDGFVYVNEKKIVEPYIINENKEFVKTLTKNPSIIYPLKVPEGMVFVMGDNRVDSTDSRELGPIKISAIRGKAIMIIAPFSKFGLLNQTWTYES